MLATALDGGKTPWTRMTVLYEYVGETENTPMSLASAPVCEPLFCFSTKLRIHSIPDL